jgi:hypothetical protein
LDGTVFRRDSFDRRRPARHGASAKTASASR